MQTPAPRRRNSVRRLSEPTINPALLDTRVTTTSTMTATYADGIGVLAGVVRPLSGSQGGSGVTEDTGSGPASRTAARQTVTASRADAASRARRRAAPEGIPIGGGEAGRGLTPLRLTRSHSSSVNVWRCEIVSTGRSAWLCRNDDARRRRSSVSGARRAADPAEPVSLPTQPALSGIRETTVAQWRSGVPAVPLRPVIDVCR